MDIYLLARIKNNARSLPFYYLFIHDALIQKILHDAHIFPDSYNEYIYFLCIMALYFTILCIDCYVHLICFFYRFSNFTISNTRV